MADENITRCSSCAELIPDVISIQHSNCCQAVLCLECYQDWVSKVQCFNCQSSVTTVTTVTDLTTFINRLCSKIYQLNCHLTRLATEFSQTAAKLLADLDHHYDNVTMIVKLIESAPVGDRQLLGQVIDQLNTLSHSLTKAIYLELDYHRTQLSLITNKSNYLNLVRQMLSPPDGAANVKSFNLSKFLLKLLQVSNTLEQLANYNPVIRDFPYQPIWLCRHRLGWSIKDSSLESRVRGGITNSIDSYPDLFGEVAQWVVPEDDLGLTAQILVGLGDYRLLFRRRNWYGLASRCGALGGAPGGSVGAINDSTTGAVKYTTSFSFKTILASNYDWLLGYYFTKSDTLTQVFGLLTGTSTKPTFHLTRLGGGGTTASATGTASVINLPQLDQTCSAVLDRDLLYIQKADHWSCYDLTNWSAGTDLSSLAKFTTNLLTNPFQGNTTEHEILYVNANLLVLQTHLGYYIVTFEPQTGQELHRATIEVDFERFTIMTIFDDDSMLIRGYDNGMNCVIYRFGPFGQHSSIDVGHIPIQTKLSLLSDGTLARLTQPGNDYEVSRY